MIMNILRRIALHPTYQYSFGLFPCSWLFDVFKIFRIYSLRWRYQVTKFARTQVCYACATFIEKLFYFRTTVRVRQRATRGNRMKKHTRDREFAKGVLVRLRVMCHPCTGVDGRGPG